MIETRRLKNVIFIQTKIRERFTYLYNVAKMQCTKNDFFQKWERIVNQRGNIILPQGLVSA